MAARAAEMGNQVTAPVTETAPAPARKGGGLNRKAGPLPVWAWAVTGVLSVAGVIIWRRRKAAATAASTPTAAPGVGPETTTAIPVPENAGISQQQYAQLLDQDRQIWEAIQDMQGPKSTGETDRAEAAERHRPDTDREEARESRKTEARENRAPGKR